MTLHAAVGLQTRGTPAHRGGFDGDLVSRIDQAAELLTIEDGFAAAEGDGLDALLLANWLGARTSRVGLVAGAAVNFLEPFHVSTAIATLDYVTEGRAGLLAQPLHGERITRARRAIGPLAGFPEPEPDALAKDQEEAIEVIRRLWDSWEDDAVIRDLVSQRFVDGDKLHYIDFKGTRFNVLGPSITPRPPQGQPVVAASFEQGQHPVACAGSDIVFLGATDEEAVATLIASLHDAGRHPMLFADVLLSFARQVETGRPALRWTGSPEDLPAQAREWGRGLGLAGLRFIPASPDYDLGPLLANVLPALRAGEPKRQGTLRERLGVPPAPNRHAARTAVAA